MLSLPWLCILLHIPLSFAEEDGGYHCLPLQWKTRRHCWAAQRRILSTSSEDEPQVLRSRRLWSLLSFQCCFTSTETVQTIRDREPRTATPSFMQLLSSMFMFNVALPPQRLYWLLGTGSPGHPPLLSCSSWAPCSCSMLLYIHRDCTDY